MDLVFSNDPDFKANVDIREPLDNSDHNMFFCELNLSIETSDNFEQNHQYIHNYCKANWKSYMEYVAMVKVIILKCFFVVMFKMLKCLLCLDEYNAITQMSKKYDNKQKMNQLVA